MNLFLKTLEGKAVLHGNDGTITVNGEGGPVQGATASVETAGAIQQRITASRLVLAGPFALAWRKKKDDREMYLLVDGETFSAVTQVDPIEQTEARKFAAAVNTAARQAPSESQPDIVNMVGKTLYDAFALIREFKLGAPALVDSKGSPAPAMSCKKWKVVEQYGTEGSLVLEVDKLK